MTTLESWKFTGLTLLALLWHTGSDGRGVLHWKTILGLGVPAAIVIGVWQVPGAAFLAVFLAAEMLGLWYTDWSGHCSTRYLSQDRKVALIVRTNPSGWKPDTHVKVPGTPSATAHEFRIQTMIMLLTAANDQHVSLSIAPRDDGLYRRYKAELGQAQDRMGIPAGRIRTFVQVRKRFPRGHDYSCPPAVNTVPA